LTAKRERPRLSNKAADWEITITEVTIPAAIIEGTGLEVYFHRHPYLWPGSLYPSCEPMFPQSGAQPPMTELIRWESKSRL
jgi:hypothetical protein